MKPCTHDELLPGEVDVVDGAADDDGALSDGGDVGVAGVRKEDGRVGSVHDQLQGDVVLKIEIQLFLNLFLLPWSLILPSYQAANLQHNLTFPRTMGWCCGEISMFIVTMLSPQLFPTAASMALFPVPPENVLELHLCSA